MCERLSHCNEGMKAIEFFEATNPSIPRFGTAGAADNQAEWIVDLTTKVCTMEPGLLLLQGLLHGAVLLHACACFCSAFARPPVRSSQRYKLQA
jgi:hypothetical protein